jgi:hypothetical protein
MPARRTRLFQVLKRNARTLILTSVVALGAGCTAGAAAFTPDPLVVGDLEALTILDALPADARGLADATRDLFTVVNAAAEGTVPVLPLLRIENTLARVVLELDPHAVVVATSGVLPQ